MNRTAHIMRAVALCFIAQSAFAQPVPNGELDRLLQRGIRSVLLQSYDEAESTFAATTERFPESPAGPLFHAAVLHQRAGDLGIEFNSGMFDSLLTLVHVRCDVRTSRDPLWNKSILATAKGMLAVEAAEEGSWVIVIRDAIASSSLAEEVLGTDSTMYDAALPLGNYYYWKTRKTEFLTWLPFVGDMRDRGIALLRKCAEHGRYQRYAALNSLVWVLIDAARVDEAIVVVNTGLDAFPRNRTFLRGLAACQERMSDPLQAAATWLEVIATLSNERHTGTFAEYASRVNRARCLLAARQYAECRQELDRAARVEIRSVPEWMKARMAAKRTEESEVGDALARAMSSR